MVHYCLILLALGTPIRAAPTLALVEVWSNMVLSSQIYAVSVDYNITAYDNVKTSTFEKYLHHAAYNSPVQPTYIMAINTVGIFNWKS